MVEKGVAIGVVDWPGGAYCGGVAGWMAIGCLPVRENRYGIIGTPFRMSRA